MIVLYTGVDPDGEPRTGKIAVADLSRWVESKFVQGWPSLSVFAPGAGEPCAEIGLGDWWADDDGEGD